MDTHSRHNRRRGLGILQLRKPAQRHRTHSRLRDGRRARHRFAGAARSAGFFDHLGRCAASRLVAIAHPVADSCRGVDAHSFAIRRGRITRRTALVPHALHRSAGRRDHGSDCSIWLAHVDRLGPGVRLGLSSGRLRHPHRRSSGRSSSRGRRTDTPSLGCPMTSTFTVLPVPLDTCSPPVTTSPPSSPRPSTIRVYESTGITDGDIIVVTSKVVAKAEGRVVEAASRVGHRSTGRANRRREHSAWCR